MVARLLEQYKNEVVPALVSEFGHANVHDVPRLEKIVVSMGTGRPSDEEGKADAAMAELALIAGQKPVPVKISIKSASGIRPTETRAKLTGCSLRANTISQIRPAT